ncbi:hypothetical protein EDB19DRAFT_1991310 [Suillus lakei]|nr:hypothetical protein EDB19DRAFT_1991310 [Suillus lakei]
MPCDEGPTNPPSETREGVAPTAGWNKLGVCRVIVLQPVRTELLMWREVETFESLAHSLAAPSDDDASSCSCSYSIRSGTPLLDVKISGCAQSALAEEIICFSIAVPRKTHTSWMVLLASSWIRRKNIPFGPYRCDRSGILFARVPTDKSDEKQKQDNSTNDDPNESAFRQDMAFEYGFDMAEVEEDVEVDYADIDSQDDEVDFTEEAEVEEIA